MNLFSAKCHDCIEWEPHPQSGIYEPYEEMGICHKNGLLVYFDGRCDNKPADDLPF